MEKLEQMDTDLRGAPAKTVTGFLIYWDLIVRTVCVSSHFNPIYK